MRDRATPSSSAITLSRPRAYARSFPGTPEHVSQARRFIGAPLGECPIAGDAVLLTSELCTNAVAHSASGRPGGRFTIRARIHESVAVHVEVEDQGSGWDGDMNSAECPHGLYLLRELSAACGTRPGAQGWIIWFTLVVPCA